MKTQNFGRSLRFLLFCSWYPHSRSTALCAPSPACRAQKNYRENRENGEPVDNPKRPFPTAGFDALDIKDSTALDYSNKWPDSSGRYWWKLTLNNGQVVNDFYWMEDKARGFPDKSNKDRYWFTVHHANGTKIEGFSQEPDYDKGYPDKGGDYWCYIQFTDTHCPAIRQWMEEKDANYMARLQREKEDKLRVEQQQRAEGEAEKRAKLEEPKRQAEREQQEREKQQRVKELELEIARLQHEEAEKHRLAQEQKAKEKAERHAKRKEAKRQEQIRQQEQAKQQREKALELEIASLKEQLVIQQQSPARLATPDLSKHEGKQKVNQPSLNDDMIKQLTLSINYEEIKIVQKLGEGAFGIVSYGQWHYEDVAVKKLHLQQMSENALIEFKEEAAIMACLHSDYIVTLKGVCLTPYVLVMEYMRGGSLFNLLHSQASLPWSIRQRIALDVAKGLAFLHRHQPLILHRDLKSQNVLLNEYQRAKLADFGLAKVRVESSRTKTHTQNSDKSVSTIPWMAPECFDIDSKYSEKSDMYAYGMVLWELTTREMPYEEVTNPNEIRAAIKEGEREEIPDEITNPKEKVPVSIKPFIQLCWLGKAERRPTAKEAMETLEQTTPSQSSASQSASSNSSGLPSGFMSNTSSFK